MDSSPISSSNSLSAPNHTPIPRHRNNYKGTLAISVNSEPKIVSGEAGYVLEDVPHFTDYIPHLPVRISLSHSHFKALFGCWEMKGKIKWIFIFLFYHYRSFVAEKMKGKRRKKWFLNFFCFLKLITLAFLSLSPMVCLVAE